MVAAAVRQVWTGCPHCFAEVHPGPCALVAHLPGKHNQKSHAGHTDSENWRGEADAASKSLAATTGSPLESSTPLGGGLTSSVSIEHHEKGTLVRKKFPDSDAVRAPDKQVDAEELSSLVGHAMGVNTPAVHKDGKSQIVMEHVKGRTWAEQSPYSAAPEHIVNSPEGRMVGLFDVLAANPDRNHGNWMTDEDGHIVAIDHGLAFGGWTAGVGSPFAQHLVNKSGSDWAEKIDISPHDMGVIKTRLDSLKPEFEARGRGSWHDDMMERLAALTPRAAGEGSIL